MAADDDDQVGVVEHLRGELGGLMVADVDADFCTRACTERSLTAVLARVPAELTWMVSPAIWRMSPAAMTDFPALLTQTNNTDVSAIFGVFP